MTRLHFSPPLNWINDPNGLVFHDGRYHLYFQYNPLGAEHGNMSWGHASSTDLVTWDDHPVAISFDDSEEIFSGSMVIDEANDSGLGTAGIPALLAFYTSHALDRRNQSQSIAYSLDGGMTFTKYAGNPVADRGSADFRDPKVIRYEGPAGSYWVMVAVEAMEQQVVFYRSDDLLSWTFLSAFGPEAGVGGVWECPDLFPLRIEGTDETAWVLLLSINPGGIAGGSGTQYFVGDFDGSAFTPRVRHPKVTPDDEAGMRSLTWLDYGHDCYAGVTFAGLADDERTLIAWMSNWLYAHDLPVDPDRPQRGAMTMARRLSLVEVDGVVLLRQEAIGPAVTDLEAVSDLAVEERVQLPVSLPPAGRLDLRVAVGESQGFTLHLGADESAAVAISYDAATRRLSVDRRRGAELLPESFVTQAAVDLRGSGEVALRVWFDPTAVEIFADGGCSVLTDLVAAPPSPNAWLEGHGEVVLRELRVAG